MTKRTKHRPQKERENNAFVAAIQAVLDYLWDDEQQHYSEHGHAGEPHVFHSLQVIRDCLNNLPAEARQADATEKTAPVKPNRSGARDRDDAVASHTVTLLEGDHGTYLIEAEDGRTVLIQTDWDYPAVASVFGWQPCPCGETDGTVDCPHRTASEMIAEASQFLDAHIGDTAEDPGYFVD